MTTNNRLPIESDPLLPPCPDWCRYDGRDHDYAWLTEDGRDARNHLIEFGIVESSTQRAASPADQPTIDVYLVQEEIASGDSVVHGELRIAIATVGYPNLTPDEARRHAAAVVAAADRADEIRRQRSLDEQLEIFDRLTEHRYDKNRSEGEQ